MVSRSLARRLRALFVALIALLAVTSGIARADEPTPSQGAPPEATVGECLAAGEVWLVIQADTDQLLRSECVGRPGSGVEALRAAAVPTTTAKGGYLCTLAGHPSRCPRTHRGQFWQYWHAAGLGATWEFSALGADSYAPGPGSIEGWCYNAEGVDRCRPPILAAGDVPAPRVDLPPATGSEGDFIVWIALAVLAMSVLSSRSFDAVRGNDNSSHEVVVEPLGCETQLNTRQPARSRSNPGTVAQP